MQQKSFFMIPISEILASLWYLVVGVCVVRCWIVGVRFDRFKFTIVWVFIVVVKRWVLVWVWIYWRFLIRILIQGLPDYEIIITIFRTAGISFDIGRAGLLLIGVKYFLGHLIDGLGDRIILILQILEHFIQLITVEQVIVHGIDWFHGVVEFFIVALF